MQVHPVVRLAWGVVSVAYKVSTPNESKVIFEPQFNLTHKVVKLQTDRDALIQQLVEEMDESCKVAQDAAPMRDHSRRSDDIVTKILLQIIQCTYFVKEYCSERCFGMYECTFGCRTII